MHGLKNVYVQSMVWNLEISLTQRLAQMANLKLDLKLGSDHPFFNS